MSNNFNFRKAQKGLKPLRLVIGGASGSGKTYTSLEFATYLSGVTGKPTAFLDTEHGRASLYADKYPFDVIELDPPFVPDYLISIIKQAEENGYGQLVVDSTTHFWNGEGGLLEIVNDIARTQFNGNSYYAWQKATPIQTKVVDAILRSKMHIIVTTRAKQEYAETEVNGKKRYEKLGVGMVQREGFEYEFDFAGMMDMDNNLLITKGMANVPPQTYFKKPSVDTIKAIMSAIQDNSVEVLSKSDMDNYKAKVNKIIEENPEKKDVYKSLFAELGHPKDYTQKEQFESLIKRMKG